MKNKTLISIIIGATSFSTTVFAATECGTGEANCWGCGTNCVARLNEGNFSISLVGDAKTATMTDYEDYRNVPWISQKSSITSITIDEGIQNIGQETLSDTTSLTSITIPSSVTSIGRSAFYGATSLESVNFGPNSKLETIGQSAFNSNTALTGIDIPDSVKSIGNAAFSRATSLESVNFGDNSKLETIGQEAFWGNTALTGIDIPDSVKSIGDYAFSTATSLESVNFGPNSKLETIGQSAFWGNTALTGIDIPDSVKSIGNGAFFGATSLESVNFGPNSKLETIGNVAFYFTGLTDFSIPDSVTEIDVGAFAGTNISTLILPESLFSDEAVGISPYAVISDNTTHLYCKEGNQKCREYQAVACNTVTLEALRCSHSGDPYRTDLTFGTYQKESDGRYVLDGVRYKSFADMQKGQNGIALKRIYTIEEANAVAGKTNTVSIRYR